MGDGRADGRMVRRRTPAGSAGCIGGAAHRVDRGGRRGARSSAAAGVGPTSCCTSIPANPVGRTGTGWARYASQAGSPTPRCSRSSSAATPAAVAPWSRGAKAQSCGPTARCGAPRNARRLLVHRRGGERPPTAWSSAPPGPVASDPHLPPRPPPYRDLPRTPLPGQPPAPGVGPTERRKEFWATGARAASAVRCGSRGTQVVELGDVVVQDLAA
jgi:hypothetical protein